MATIDVVIVISVITKLMATLILNAYYLDVAILAVEKYNYLVCIVHNYIHLTYR